MIYIMIAKGTITNFVSYYWSKLSLN